MGIGVVYEAVETVELFDIPIAQLTEDEFCALVLNRVQSHQPGYVVTPNVQHICRHHRDAEFRTYYADAFLAIPDGVPLMWAARLFGRPLKAKLSGSDMVPRLCALAAEKNLSIYLLGGLPGTNERCAELLRRQYPDLRIAGMDCPDYGFEHRPADLEAVVERARAAQPDILFVALGCPKQEKFMYRFSRRIGAGVSLGVGGSLDMLCGRVKRAPRLLQNLGLEWLWRLGQEPRRLWRRYLVEDTIFFKLVWREYQRQRRMLSQSVEDRRR